MDFNFSDLQRMMLDSAQRLIGDHFTLEHRRALRDKHDGFDAEAWGSFAEMGWLALAITEEQGGLGGSLEDVAVLMTVFGSKLVIEPYVSSAILATHILGNADSSQEDLLAAVGGGESRIALAHSEPDERYAFDSPRRVVLSPRGDGFHLAGQKMLVVDAQSADQLIISASIEGKPGIALVRVDIGAEGVSANHYMLVDGSRAADISFDVEVAADAILVGPERGAEVLAEALDRARIALLAQAVGSMESCLQICSNYLKDRQQFGQPIGKFQALQHIMADMFVATHQSRSALYQALAHARADAAARARAVSLAALTIGEASQLVSRQGIQLHGGYGVTDEYEISHHFRRLFVIEKSYGDLDFHTRRLA